MYCENQIDPVTWWHSTEFRQKSFISLSLATKREIQKSETMSWKTILMQSFWYQKFEDPTIHVTVATCAKFWGLKFQNGLTHAKLRGRNPIFRYCPIIRTCSFIWACQNKFSTAIQSSGFISTESQLSYFWHYKLIDFFNFICTDLVPNFPTSFFPISLRTFQLCALSNCLFWQRVTL